LPRVFEGPAKEIMKHSVAVMIMLALVACSAPEHAASSKPAPGAEAAPEPKRETKPAALANAAAESDGVITQQQSASFLR